MKGAKDRFMATVSALPRPGHRASPSLKLLPYLPSFLHGRVARNAALDEQPRKWLGDYG